MTESDSKPCPGVEIWFTREQAKAALLAVKRVLSSDRNEGREFDKPLGSAFAKLSAVLSELEVDLDEGQRK